MKPEAWAAIIATTAALVTVILMITPIPWRRTLHVWADGVTLAHVDAEGSEVARRAEVTVRLETGRRPVVVEVITLQPARNVKGSWVISIVPGPPVAGWPDPPPQSLTSLRLDANSSERFRLGAVAVPAARIGGQGEAKLQAVAQLSRSEYRAPRLSTTAEDEPPGDG